MAVREEQNLGSLLKRYRLAAGLTQEELAERAEMSARGISDLERGLSRSPYPNTLRRLADALELSGEQRTGFLAAWPEGSDDPTTLQVPADTTPPIPIRHRRMRLAWLPAACLLALALGVAGAILLRPTGSRSATAGPVRSTAAALAVLATWGTASGSPIRLANPFAVPGPGGETYLMTGPHLFGTGVSTLGVARISASGRQLAAWRAENVYSLDAQVDARGDLWVTDDPASDVSAPGPHIEEFSPNGRVIARLANGGTNAGQLDNPIGLAVAPQGDLVVGDGNNSRVQVLSPAGRQLAVWGGPFNLPLAMYPDNLAVDRAGDVYVLDSNNRQLDRFSLQGKLRKAWSLPKKLPGSWIAPWDLTVDPAGNVYVLVPGPPFSIWKYSPEGRLLATWTHFAIHAGSSRMEITSFRFDDRGIADAIDIAGKRLLKIDTAGHVVATWPLQQLEQPLFHSPDTITTDSAGNVYVTEGNRVTQIAADGGDVRSWGAGFTSTQAPGPLSVAGTPDGNVVVLSENGRRIETLSSSGALLGGWGKIGIRPEDLARPAAVGVAGNGDVLVYDTFHGCNCDPSGPNPDIKVFSPRGKLLHYWCTCNYPLPNDGVTRPMTVDAQGNVYVNTPGEVVKFSPRGVALRSFGQEGRGPGRLYVTGSTAVDGAGNVYVVDPGAQTLQVFAQSGRLLAYWTRAGAHGARFSSLGDVTLDRAGNIYLLDGSQVVEFAPLASR